MSDEKIIDLGTKKPFELVTGGEGTSDEPIKVLLQRMLRYANERKFKAVAIIMVDEKHSTITGYHMEENMGVTLSGGVEYMAYRLHKFMDED